MESYQYVLAQHSHMRALNALWQRGALAAPFTSERFTERLDETGARPSFSDSAGCSSEVGEDAAGDVGSGVGAGAAGDAAHGHFAGRSGGDRFSHSVAHC